MLLCFHTTLCSKLCQHNSPRPKGGALVVAHLRRLDVPVNLIRPRHLSNNTLGEGERGLSPRPLLPPSNINHHLNLPCSRWLQWGSIVQPSSSLKHVVVAWKHLSMMHTHVLNKCGIASTQIPVMPNYIVLRNRPDCAIFKYNVSYSPQVDSRKRRIGMLYQQEISAPRRATC